MAESIKRCFFIQGPTGVGKNSLALEVAAQTGASLVNVDSVQLYRGLNIGANSPTPDDFSKAPHYFYNFLDLNERITVGEYKRLIEEFLRKEAADKLLYFVGGSGFYFQALDKGIPELQPVSDEVKAQVEALDKSHDKQGLWDQLNKLNPKAATTLHPNDRYRVLRALTLVLSQKKSPKEIEQDMSGGESPLQAYKISKMALYLERDELKVQLQKRTQLMLDQGLADEVRDLLKSYDKSCPALQTIGYKEVIAYLEGQISQDQAKEDILKNSMLLAKKQMTWLRRDKEIHWFHSVKERAKAKEFLLMP